MTIRAGWGILLLAGTMVAAIGGGRSAMAREDVNLNDNWRFLREDVADAAKPAFDDAKWQTLRLPHTWNNLDGQDGGNDYYRGSGWYRKHLVVDPAWAGKCLVLKFDGANRVTEVFVNGRKLGSHTGGFGAFAFDATDALKPGADNVLAVHVSNAFNADSPPLSADFTFFGGLYRSVHLLVLDPLGVSPLDFASPGVYVKQAKVTPEQAELEITTKLRNAGTKEQAATVRATVTDKDGRVVAKAEQKQAAAAGATVDVVQPLSVAQPHLWNGRQDPYLYQVTVEVTDGQATTDRVTVPLGLRFFRVDPNKGFFLNGKHLHLHGVNRHQDRIDRGWAITPAEHEEDFAMVKELGCTAIRLAHYQHAQEFYNLCDSGGIVVWAEIPLVDKITHNQAFADNAKQQLTELIKQNYNHPSICFWSMFNELALGGKETAKGNLPEQLAKLAKQLDPTRLTAAANCGDPDHRFNFYTDVLGFNLYFGWYKKDLGGLGKHLDGVHKKHPTWNIALTEYGAGASIKTHEEHPTVPKSPIGPHHPEEWQSIVHESNYKALRSRPYIWGTFVWNMFDFAADQRKEGDHLGRNDKGLVTYDRKVRKDAFYFYKANWTSEPMVYITSRRFATRDHAATDVKVYSNCASVELKLNGKSLGAKTAKDHIFVWEGVTLRPGENTVEAIGSQEGKTAADQCQWTLRAAK